MQLDQSPNSTKDGLLHNFKYYQDVSDTRLGSGSRLSGGMKTGNLKPLPPLKASTKFVQDSDSASICRRSFSSDSNLKDGKKLAANATFNARRRSAANATAFSDGKNLYANATFDEGKKIAANATFSDRRKLSTAKEVDKFFRFGKLGEEFHSILKLDDCKAVKPEGKTSNCKEVLMKDKYGYFSDLSKQDRSNSHAEISWLDDW